MTPFRVVGTSMWPVLKAGDLVFVEAKEAKTGDLVLRVIDRMPTVHRFIETCLTKGDRYSKADPLRADNEPEWLTVVSVIPRKYSDSAGQLRQAWIRDHNLNVRLQLFLSRSHLRANGILKLALLTGLIINGIIIRSRFYAQCQRTLNVVHDEF